MQEKGNTNLHNAKRNKQDEFYTKLSDIENELRHYKEHFKNKIVLCNCDDPYESNFFKYFALNFNALGLKKLLCIGYKDSPVAGEQISLFDTKDFKPAHLIEINEVRDLDGDGDTDLADVEVLLKNDKNVVHELKGNGDFRSDECIEILKRADIVVTNPPFSLFREYLAQLFEYEKDFLILGNQNAITYKEVFPLIKDNKMWLGYHYGHTLFEVPDYYTIPDFYDLNDKQRLSSNGYKIDENGKLWRNLGNICWYTNLDIKKRHEDLVLYKNYSPKEYPTYDDYDVIEVKKVVEIPMDYDGIMGVPITFINKYNPDQFEILGIANSARFIGDVECYTIINGKKIYNRILIKRK